jgi:hypothetical protein
MTMRNLVSTLALLLVAGCQGPVDPQPPPPAPPPDPPPSGDGETCAAAIDISVAREQGGGTTVGAEDDLSGSCSGQQAPDVVYRVTITEPSGLIARAEGVEYDVGLYLLADGCEREVPGACSDAMMNQLAIEEVKVPLLDPGDYYLVVEGYGLPGGPATGDFTLDVVLYPGGVCIGDFLDANAGDATAATATFAGGRDIDTNDTNDPGTVGPDPFPLTLCDGNVDMFSVGHLGGALSVATPITRGDGTVTTDILHATLDGDALAEGAPLGQAPFDGDAPRGYYLVKVTGSDLGSIGTDYALIVAHECEPDDLDDADASLDDERYQTTLVGAFEPLEDAVERSVCLTDKDTFVLDNVVAGDVVVDLDGAAALRAMVDVVDRSGVEPVVTPYAGFDAAVSAADLVVALADAPAGRYLLTVDGGDDPPAAALAYSFQATFAGVADAPANDACAAAVALDGGVAIGRTITGSDDVDLACNGDDEAAAGLGTADVFYTLHLDAQTDLALSFDGSVTGFRGALGLFAYPGTCPSSMSELVVVEQAMGPACLRGEAFDLRLRGVAAGDYLVVVDGVFRPEQQTMMGPIAEVNTRGGFHLSSTLHPDGLPPLAACTAAEPLPLPAAGATVELSFDNSALGNQIMAYGACSEGGYGAEKVFTFQPDADATLDITADGYDTVVSVREGDCEFGTQIACNDDVNFNGGDYSSRVVGVDVRAGVTYYVLVDAWSDDQLGQAIVRIDRP